MRAFEDIVAQFTASGEPYGVFINNNLGSRPDYLRALSRARTGGENLERGGHPRRHELTVRPGED